MFNQIAQAFQESLSKCCKGSLQKEEEQEQYGFYDGSREEMRRQFEEMDISKKFKLAEEEKSNQSQKDSENCGRNRRSSLKKEATGAHSRVSCTTQKQMNDSKSLKEAQLQRENFVSKSQTKQEKKNEESWGPEKDNSDFQMHSIKEISQLNLDWKEGHLTGNTHLPASIDIKRESPFENLNENQSEDDFDQCAMTPHFAGGSVIRDEESQSKLFHKSRSDQKTPEFLMLFKKRPISLSKKIEHRSLGHIHPTEKQKFALLQSEKKEKLLKEEPAKIKERIIAYDVENKPATIKKNTKLKGIRREIREVTGKEKGLVTEKYKETFCKKKLNQ